MNFDQLYLYWKNEGRDYQPDVLMLMLSPNDLREGYNKGLIKIGESDEIIVNKPNLPEDE